VVGRVGDHARFPHSGLVVPAAGTGARPPPRTSIIPRPRRWYRPRPGRAGIRPGRGPAAPARPAGRGARRPARAPGAAPSPPPTRRAELRFDNVLTTSSGVAGFIPRFI